MSLTDQFSRPINYLRVSVTDRCDLRCVYCMKEKMTFLPRNEVLTLEEIERLCDNFIEMGVNKIRLTGGEPLVRKDIMKLIERLNLKKNNTNLKEITLTTNGTLLNGEDLVPRNTYDLNDGDEIKVGDTTLLFKTAFKI